jgi:hypothetical protein
MSRKILLNACTQECCGAISALMLLFSVLKFSFLWMHFINLFFFSCFVLIADHVREFTCGKLFYRTFHLDEERDALYVGAM